MADQPSGRREGWNPGTCAVMAKSDVKGSPEASKTAASPGRGWRFAMPVVSALF
jgi:hypothetical protein